MKLMQAWRDSLQLLHPKQLKPFLMVTAKAVVGIYKDINKPLTSRGNWELAGVVLFLIGLSNVIQMQYLFWLEGALLNGMRYLFFFLFALALRPSVGTKNFAYYKEYIVRFKYALAATILLGITPFFAIPFLLLWWMLFLFFWFDSSATFSSMLYAKGQATKLLVYNFPLCLVLQIALWFIGYIFLDKFVGAAMGLGGLTLAVVVYLLIVPIQVALISNLYIKKFHDQPDLYLKQHIG